MTDPMDPPDIARRDFEVVRRGYDQNAVRGFLHQVSAQLARVLAAETDLTERLKRAEKRLAAAEAPDEAAMLELLGEETTRVLGSAREASADIRSKAEQAAERIIADATALAAQTRAGAVAEADKRMTDARAEAEKILTAARSELDRRTKEAAEAAERITAEAAGQVQAARDEAQRLVAAATEQGAAFIEAAKEEGKGLVTEAQAVRERVLRDLSVRRRKARAQIEQLNAGRERLLQAYDVVRTTIDDATNELSASVTDARIAAAAAVRRVEAEPDASPEQLDEELAAAYLAELPITVTTVAPLAQIPKGRLEREERARAEREAAADAEPAPAEPAPAPSSTEVTSSPPSATEAPRYAPTPSDFDPMPSPERPKPLPDPEPAAELAPEPVAEEPIAPAPDPTPELAAEPEAPPESPSKAADVFARLHADVDPPQAEAPEAADIADASDPAPEEPAAPVSAHQQAFDDRAAALEPIDRDLAKRLKRALADEQNEVLDKLRRGKPSGMDEVLPSPDDHAARWAEAASGPLADAAKAGARWSDGKARPTAELTDAFARGLVQPLRERIERSFQASDGNLDDVSDRVRALYREWKNQRLPEAVPHHTAVAYAQGLFDAVAPDAKVHWVADPAKDACPDCDDNVLAGPIAKGDGFPTGDRCAPAHPGCRCLVLVLGTT